MACAVALSEALAMATGSPGAPALTTAGNVGSHGPSAASAGPARPTSTPNAATMGQTTLMRRNPLRFINQQRIDLFTHQYSM